ncbi:LON peptidase substrate-binding domain-containing protein [Dermatophilus congolensis]|uniref:Lon protease 2 n=1 Tax=Dermatophilus congolensis TaxID=1863 RepID=A0A239V7A4_9MICO|nr:LON peptidase substrate-binding domain-containing protein [Dermatophilus congolensis]MBO3130303.1 LON peptidase substrate-binding domain-containing protein [Dermatophilus congolensis]MBO3131066.1 LON peptidase substrate-binding domain-containing protein [Dermatophilus congolensis]MBO3134774.1 LON peptidase substrate-binding domain-containing protein [Dermatophilus congolensis]MBO3137010.1 LON peptidase substrate-binding domain-containing protein [Dermatophilus congolensis]MBO3139255.1 LON p
MARLPLFPLNTVLAPGAALPLQIHEHRHLQLIRDVVRSPEGPEFGVVALRHGRDPDERARIRATVTGCSAVLQNVDNIGSGRLHLDVRGKDRFRVDKILDEPLPYVVAEVTWLSEPDGDEAALPSLARQVRSRLYNYSTMLGQDAPTNFEPRSRRDVDSARRLSYGVIDHTVLSLDEKISLLEAESTEQRLIRARRLLSREIDLIRLFHAIPQEIDPSAINPN